uniref:N-acetyltransferase domain-containing protein n=1 Tax=Globodera rostochiensis TaxID=31243 RepID=A0A914HEJ8_GLORO
MSFALVPLVDKPELIDQCIDLLNEEWPRSREWRRVGLERLLCPSPPMAYVLIDIASGTLVGHARLCPLDLEGSGCWVESVLVRKGMRGRGTGQKLMAMVEAEARRHGFNKICLSTTDQTNFYRHCSYQESNQPIQNCGSSAPLFNRLGLACFLRSTGQNVKETDTLNAGPNTPQNRLQTKYL